MSWGGAVVDNGVKKGYTLVTNNLKGMPHREFFLKSVFIDAIVAADNLDYFRHLDAEALAFVKNFHALKELAFRFFTGKNNNPWSFFSLFGTPEDQIVELCDFSAKATTEANDDFHLSADEKNKIFISPYIHDKSHLGDLIAVVEASNPHSDSEWHLFTDMLATRICSKHQLPDCLAESPPDDAVKMLNFMRETQITLNVSRRVDAMPPGNEKRQAQLWHEQDGLVLNRFLSKLIQSFNLHTAFIVQNAAPGYINKFITTSRKPAAVIHSEIDELIEAAVAQSFFDESISSETILETEVNGYLTPNLVPLVFSCQASGTTYGHLGFLASESYVKRNFNHRSRLMPMLASQLGLHFSHYYQLRKEALHGRMLQQINQTCNTINSSVDIGAILFKLVESLNYLFGQFSGAILIFSRESGELEVVNYLSGDVPEGLNVEEIISQPGPVLEAINEGSAFDNRSGHYKLPIRYVLPLASTPQASIIDSDFVPLRSLGGVILFESPNNRSLSEEDLGKLMPILLNGISASLQVACNYAEKLDTIEALEGMMARLADTDALLDEMILIIRRLLKVNRISFLSLTKEGTHLFIKKSYGIPKEIIDNTLIKLGEEISGYVAKQGKSYRIDNIEAGGMFKKRSQEDYLNRSLLSVPLTRISRDGERQVIGVINVNNKTSGLTFSVQDQQLLEAIAHLVVTALDNVRLLEEQHEQKLIERQLKDARDIQMSLLPKTFANLPESIEAYGRSIPAKQIGGDFFDIIRLENGNNLIVLGDVSGKGMPAAILMAMTRMIVRSASNNCSDLPTLLGNINTQLSRELDSYHFVTLQLVSIDPNTGAAEMSSAGHGPLMAKLDGQIKLIEAKSGPPLGISGIPIDFDNIPFNLKGGDCFILYTDGLSEERSESREMFGTDRITEILDKNSEQSAEELTQSLIAAVTKWRGIRDAHDDLTILTIKFKGQQ